MKRTTNSPNLLIRLAILWYKQIIKSMNEGFFFFSSEFWLFNDYFWFSIILHFLLYTFNMEETINTLRKRLRVLHCPFTDVENILSIPGFSSFWSLRQGQYCEYHILAGGHRYSIVLIPLFALLCWFIMSIYDCLCFLDILLKSVLLFERTMIDGTRLLAKYDLDFDWSPINSISNNCLAPIRRAILRIIKRSCCCGFSTMLSEFPIRIMVSGLLFWWSFHDF